MSTICEKVMSVENEVAMTVENHTTECRRGLAMIASVLGEHMVGTELVHKSLGTGKVVSVSGGYDLTTMTVEVQFENELRRFGLKAMVSSYLCPIRITDPDVLEAVAIAEELYNKWHWQEVNLSIEASRIQREIDKKAEEEKKAELKYQRQKESSIRAFDKMAGQTRETSGVDEFYYALGWIVKHVNSISAAMPDYLETAFKNHFGADTPCRVVDSKHRGPAGWQSQWSWSFKISLKKYDDMPSVLVPYMSPSGKEITSTEFIWDLIDTYGFQFGKKQDEAKIEACIPVQFFNSYLDGKQA